MARLGAAQNWEMRKAASLADMREIFGDRHFWIGYRQAWDGKPFLYDCDFGGLTGAALKLAQLRYEDGRDVAIAARAGGPDEPWPAQHPLPLRLMLWLLDD